MLPLRVPYLTWRESSLISMLTTRLISWTLLEKATVTWTRFVFHPEQHVGRGALTSVQTISTVAIDVPLLAPEQLAKVDAWLRSVLWENEVPGVAADQTRGLEIHRLKARLVFNDGAVKMVQGVREIFEVFDAPAGSTEESGTSRPSGKLVLIGRQLPGSVVENSFLAAIQ